LRKAHETRDSLHSFCSQFVVAYLYRLPIFVAIHFQSVRRSLKTQKILKLLISGVNGRLKSSMLIIFKARQQFLFR